MSIEGALIHIQQEHPLWYKEGQMEKRNTILGIHWQLHNLGVINPDNIYYKEIKHSHVH